MIRAILLVAAFATVLAACGGGTNSAPPAPSPAVPPPPAAIPGSRTSLEIELPEAGATIAYTLVLPDAYEPGTEHPILLAFPPGGQGQEEVDVGLDFYWEAEARRRGWIVVSPVAPGGSLFFQGSEELVPEFLDALAVSYPPEGGVFHVAGISNGGLSAFRVALESPERFASLLVLPGFPPAAGDFDRLESLASLPVALYVGENDTDWRAESERTAARLRELGGEVTLTVSPGEGHILRNIDPAELFDFLDSAPS